MVNMNNNPAKLIVAIVLGLSLSTAMANNRYANDVGQGIWYSSSNSPSVQVFIDGTALYAKVTLESLSVDLPATRLKSINSVLLNEYTPQYILMQDFNDDGFTDIGVLKSVGYGGSNRCYSVFEYKPDFFSYKAHPTKTVCIE